MSETTITAVDTPGDDDAATEASPTRPHTAGRTSQRRSRAPRAVTRFTLDLERQQHVFLKMFGFQNSVEGSKVMRTLLYLLETDPDLKERVIEEIWADEPTPVDPT